MTSIKGREIVVYDYGRDCAQAVAENASMAIFRGESSISPSTQDAAEEIAHLKQWRKGKPLIAGLGVGIALFFVLGPIGGVAGGLAGAYTTKRLLKRREKKVVDRLMAMQYPLMYNSHGVLT